LSPSLLLTIPFIEPLFTDADIRNAIPPEGISIGGLSAKFKSKIPPGKGPEYLQFIAAVKRVGLFGQDKLLRVKKL
jgi:hypothetical protein